MKSPVTQIPQEARPWLEWLRTKGRSERTLYNYTQTIRLVARFWAERGGPTSLRAVRTADLDRWRQHNLDRHLNAVTRDGYLRPLTVLFRWLADRGVVFLNPAENIVVPRPRRRLLPVVSERDMSRFLDQPFGTSECPLRDRAILEVSYSTGMRIGELQRLDVEDVNLEEAVVSVLGKGQKERVLPLTAKAVAAVRDYLEQERPKYLRNERERALWLRSKVGRGRRMSLVGFFHLWRRRSRQTGVKITAHGMRRAFATHLLRRGLGPHELRVLLGHATFRQIQHYVRYAMVDLRRAHARSRLAR